MTREEKGYGAPLRFFALGAITSKAGVFNILHFHLFHGRSVSDKSSVLPPMNHLGTPGPEPIKLIRNVYKMPDISRPGLSLVVSSRVRAELEGFPNVGFLPVEFAKLVYYPYKKGDFSYFDTPSYHRDPVAEDPETLLDRLPDVSDTHKVVEPYYELLVPRLKDVNTDKSGLSTITINDEYYYNKSCTISLSHETLNTFPITWRSYLITNELFYSSIAKYIDHDYFSVKSLSI